MAHFLQRGFGYLAQARIGVGVEYFDVALAARTQHLAAQAHGVELVFAYEIGNIGHGASKGLCGQVEGQIECVEVAPATRFV